MAQGPGEFGKRLMEKMGWKQGLGLGKDLNGATSHVRIAKKDDTKGLGVTAYALIKAEEDADQSKRAQHAFSNAKLRSVGGKVESDSEEEEEEEGDFNGIDVTRLSKQDLEMFLLCGKRRLGRRAGRPQKGKWNREMLADKSMEVTMGGRNDEVGVESNAKPTEECEESVQREGQEKKKRRDEPEMEQPVAEETKKKKMKRDDFEMTEDEPVVEGTKHHKKSRKELIDDHDENDASEKKRKKKHRSEEHHMCSS